MKPFSYRTLPASILFGAGSRRQIAALLEELGHSRALVLTTPEQRDLGQQTVASIGSRGAGLFDGARMHTPVEVTNKAVAVARSAQVDCLIAIGGGSTTGLAKAISVRTGLPQIIVPTTYAGSEVTPILGETENGKKRTRRQDAILPEWVVYDPDLTHSLPVQATLTSGMNAIAHAVEALYAPDSSPIIRLMALEATAKMLDALPLIHAEPENAAARSDALYSAWLCGTCLGATTMGLHHKICHILGGTFDLPHAQTHCIMLPHVLSYNRHAATQAHRDIGAALGTDNPERALFDLVVSLDGPVALEAIGMHKAGLDEVIAQLLAAPYANPAPMDEHRLRMMLDDAWSGRPPHDWS